MRKIEFPPVWLIACMVVMWAVSKAAPVLSLPVLVWPGRVLVILAVLAMVWAAVTMARARTTVVPRRAPSALVTQGPFRFSRNPIYLADVVVLIGWALGLGALSAWFVIPLFALVIDRRFIRGEEAALEAAFGEAWRGYAARVRRWI